MEIADSPVVHFHLRPFSCGSMPPGLRIAGTVARWPGLLAIAYHLAGDLSRIILPQPVPAASRRHNLWRRTCLEFFFAPAGGNEYWEGNLAPSGDWNLYRFADYRQDMVEELRVDGFTCRTVREPARLEISCSLVTDSLFPAEAKLLMGIACVILEENENVSYWAVEHCGERPDFHDRRGFVLAPAGVSPAMVNEVPPPHG